METLKQNQRVKFKIGDLEGTGKVVGISTNPQAVIGCSYIIEPDKSINNETYPYSHFTCFQIQLEIIN